MTTPLPVMPTAAVLPSTVGNSGFYNPKSKSEDIPISPGISTIAASWDGPQAVTVYVCPDGRWASRIIIGSIPAGTGRRRVTIPDVGASSTTATLRVTSNPVQTQADVDARRQATVQIVTIPLAGGGSLWRAALKSAWRRWWA